MANFNTAVNIVFKHEGGYVNNPNDPGGETKYGISKHRYPAEDIANLTKERARQLYYNDFWIRNSLQSIGSQKKANFALDTVVNHGQGGRLIQKAINRSGGSVSEDNRIGNQTIAALNSVDEKRFIQQGVLARRQYYDELIRKDPRLAEFRKGWYKRVDFFLGDWKLPTMGGIAVLATLLILYYLKRR